MIEILKVASELEQFLSSQGWRFAFIGGLAVNRWGRPRTTNDVDLTLLSGFGQEEPFVDTLLEQYVGRIEQTREFALKNRVVLIQSHTSVGIDISLGALPFEEQAIDRSTPFKYPENVTLTTVSAEDLVVLKAVAGRPQDWMDIEGVLVRQSARIKMDRIRSELTPLCELLESTEPVERMEQLWQMIQAA